MECVALLGAELPPRPSEATTRVNGARVAASDAFLAILRHGSADRYDILSLEDPAPGAIDAYRAGLANAGVEMRRVQVAPLPRGRDALRSQRYLALHDTSGPHLGRLVGALRPLAPEPTPATATAFTLSYGNLIPPMLDLLATARPFDAVFCPSVAAQEALRRLLDHLRQLPGLAGARAQPRLALIPLGVDVGSYAPAVPRPVARRLLGLPEEGRYVAYVGRLSPFDKADLDVLLRSFAMLARESADLRLLLAGDDTQRSSVYLRGRAQALGVGPVVHVLTNLTETSKRLVYWGADVFASPADSVQESFGLTVLEAMAAGLPAVVADWSGYRDLVRDGDSGFLIPTLGDAGPSAVDTMAEFGNFLADHTLLAQGVALDEDALTDRLRLLLEDAGLRALMGSRAQEQAAGFAWPLVVRRYEETWRRLKQEAMAAPAVAAPLRLPYGEIFGHFATRALQPTDLVALRPQPVPAPPPPVSFQLLVPQDTIRRLLAILSQGPQPVGALAGGESEWLALLWLAKTGSVRVTAGDLSP